jgi:4-hydroxybenzoyl-CoA thioesterase
VFARHVPVRFAHCDAAGLIFFPHFLALVNEMVEDWFAGPLAHPFKSLHLDARKGVPTASLSARFIRPVRLGDELEQTLSIDRLGRSSCHIKHGAMVRGEAVAAFDQTIVYADLESMRSEPWPSALRMRMSAFMGGRA